MRIENTNYVNYLIELSQSGRKNAFFDLCEINLISVFTIIYRLTADYDLSRKLTINTFLEAWDKIKNYDYKISFVLWIKNIAIRHALENLNRLSTSSIDIEMTEDRLKNLENLIMNLDYERRIIFVLHDLEGYSYEEITELVGYDFLDEVKTKLIETRNYLINKLCK